MGELLSEVTHQRRPRDPGGTKTDKPVTDDGVKTGEVSSYGRLDLGWESWEEWEDWPSSEASRCL